LTTLEDFLFQGSLHQVKSEEDADRALHLYRKHKEMVDEFTRQRNRLIARANVWLAEMCNDHLIVMHCLEEMMKDYYIERLSEDPRLLTISRPFGQFGLVRDEEGCAFRVDVDQDE
jgi:hypothetical protein